MVFNTKAHLLRSRPSANVIEGDLPPHRRHWALEYFLEEFVQNGHSKNSPDRAFSAHNGLSANNAIQIKHKYQPTLHVCTSLMTNGMLLITGFVNKEVIIPRIQIFGIYALIGKMKNLS